MYTSGFSKKHGLWCQVKSLPFLIFPLSIQPLAWSLKFSHFKLTSIVQKLFVHISLKFSFHCYMHKPEILVYTFKMHFCIYMWEWSNQWTFSFSSHEILIYLMFLTFGENNFTYHFIHICCWRLNTTPSFVMQVQDCFLISLTDDSHTFWHLSRISETHDMGWFGPEVLVLALFCCINLQLKDMCILVAWIRW